MMIAAWLIVGALALVYVWRRFPVAPCDRCGKRQGVLMFHGEFLCADCASGRDADG